ncbi:M20 family metallopeptidase [Aquamicrobium sp. LC103]|uniref:M20 family metallopeptidase n=1 Tax=Aquamicrobium sp. LC103 TaxID=1120658 RepID=UPI00063EBA15|nr:M20 family metallopeptidase [Aquamicrobium sp. LC103]TKT78343.1 M20 family metallopeptidase [Aquamicrobium sp. LC103]
MYNSYETTQRILQGIQRWAAMESPSNRPDQVDGLVGHVAVHLESIGASCERPDLGSGCARPLVARFNANAQGGPRILVLGHLDTVHPMGSIDGPMPLHVEGDRLYGPGVMDMKGGVYLAVDALERLSRSQQMPEVPITVLLNTDEEIGSPFSRGLIEAEAQAHDFVLVPEPVREGHVVIGRFAFARFRLTTHGQSAHAGADNVAGRSAIRAMANIIERLEDLTDMRRLVSFNVGVVQGGEFVNVVPLHCSADVLAVADSEANLAYVHDVMSAVPRWSTDVEIEVATGPQRPLFLPSTGTMWMFDQARIIGAELGLELKGRVSGGGSDGNFTGALGVPTLDGLGVAGKGPHTRGEYLEIGCLAARSELLRRLIELLADSSGPFQKSNTAE